MDSPRQLADALKGRDVRQTMNVNGVARAQDVRSPSLTQMMIPVHPSRRNGMFGEAPKRKVLCSCGAIAEVDLRMANTKMNLGKVVECRACRNNRIAREKEELEKHFSGQEEEELEW